METQHQMLKQRDSKEIKKNIGKQKESVKSEYKNIRNKGKH